MVLDVFQWFLSDGISYYFLVTCESPLYTYPHSKTVLMQAINNDVTFLASQSVMDYSLLVGLDEVTQELVVGIIGRFFCRVVH